MSRLEELNAELERVRNDKKLEADELKEAIPDTKSLSPQETFDEMINAFKKQKDGSYKILIRHISWDRLCSVVESFFIDEPNFTGKVPKPRTIGKVQAADFLEDMGLKPHCIKYITYHKEGDFSIRLGGLDFDRALSILKTTYLENL